jgi:hypothetical protein
LKKASKSFALKIFDEVHHSNAVNPLVKLLWAWMKKRTSFRALEEPWKSLILYWLIPVSDWLHSLIGPSGLLLLVGSLPPTYLQSQFQFCGWGWQKISNQNLDVRNIFAGSHTEHWWRF